jgi:hypothetical protein
MDHEVSRLTTCTAWTNDAVAPYAERRVQANTMREAAQALISTVREIRTKTCTAYNHIRLRS